jgi:hypothetical protein
MGIWVYLYFTNQIKDGFKRIDFLFWPYDVLGIIMDFGLIVGNIIKG